MGRRRSRAQRTRRPQTASTDLLARAPAHGPASIGKAIVRAGWADAVAGDFAHALARLDTLADGGDPTVLADARRSPPTRTSRSATSRRRSTPPTASSRRGRPSDDLVRYSGALIWAARFALLRGETTAAYELAREGERIARPFALRAQAAALHATLAEAALHVGDTALARREARAALRSADAAWYARDAQRARALGLAHPRTRGRARRRFARSAGGQRRRRPARARGRGDVRRAG